MYLLRFAARDSSKNWKIRQIGVYHRYRKGDDTHFWIFLQSHPINETAFSIRLSEVFASPDGRASFNDDPFCLHELLFDTYVHDWRWYLNDLGREYGKQVRPIDSLDDRPC